MLNQVFQHLDNIHRLDQPVSSKHRKVFLGITHRAWQTYQKGLILSIYCYFLLFIQENNFSEIAKQFKIRNNRTADFMWMIKGE